MLENICPYSQYWKKLSLARRKKIEDKLRKKNIFEKHYLKDEHVGMIKDRS